MSDLPRRTILDDVKYDLASRRYSIIVANKATKKLKTRSEAALRLISISNRPIWVTMTARSLSRSPLVAASLLQTCRVDQSAFGGFHRRLDAAKVFDVLLCVESARIKVQHPVGRDLGTKEWR